MQGMHRIFIAEDENMPRRELKSFLEKNGFQVAAPDEKEISADRILEEKPDLILMDIGLGKDSGLRLCREVRKRASVPVIFVTAQDTVQSEIVGFAAGGDDYIRKPYHLPVLLARIRSLLERASGAEDKLAVEGVALDLVFGQLVWGEERYELSKKEQQILYYLFRSHPRAVGRDELIEYLWENKLFVDENILNVNLSRIRKRLRGTALENFIRTAPEKGYLIGLEQSDNGG